MNVFMQDLQWTTKEGQTLNLVDMTSKHRKNLLAFLERRASNLKWNYAFTLTMDLALETVLGDMATDRLESMVLKVEEQEPLEWLYSTPLVKRLIELIEKDEASG